MMSDDGSEAENQCQNTVNFEYNGSTEIDEWKEIEQEHDSSEDISDNCDKVLSQGNRIGVHDQDEEIPALKTDHSSMPHYQKPFSAGKLRQFFLSYHICKNYA